MPDVPQLARRVEDGPGVMFVRNDLDEYGLNPYEFRVYGHIYRRTGGKFHGVSYASVKTMAEVCGMSSRRVQYALKFLCKAGFLIRQESNRRTNAYMLAPVDKWTPKAQLEGIRKAVKSPVVEKSESKAQEQHSSDDAGEEIAELTLPPEFKGHH